MHAMSDYEHGSLHECTSIIMIMLSRSSQDEYKDGDQIENQDQDQDENNVLLEVTLELSSPAVLHVYKCTYLAIDQLSLRRPYLHY